MDLKRLVREVFQGIETTIVLIVCIVIFTPLVRYVGFPLLKWSVAVGLPQALWALWCDWWLALAFVVVCLHLWAHLGTFNPFGVIEEDLRGRTMRSSEATRQYRKGFREYQRGRQSSNRKRR